MPAVSEAQRRAMYAARAGKSTLGIPKSVGEEFVGKDMKPEDWDGLVRGLLKFLSEEAEEPEHAEDAGKKSLYVSRDLLNADEVIAWAKAQGFKQTLAPDDMHVTIAFSREPVDWTEAGDSVDHLQVGNGLISVQPLGDKGGIVALFDSPELHKRWQEFRDVGASWDWPEYKPHITLTYSGEGAPPDLSKVEPYTGELKFGPEKYAEVDDNWTDKIKEQAQDAALAMDRGIYDARGKRILAFDIIALDKSPSVRSYDKDGQLHITRTPISKANICEYYGHEIPGAQELGLDPTHRYRLLRHPDELRKGAKSSNGKQLMIQHVPVSADDPKKDVWVGATHTNAEYEHPFLFNGMTVHDREGIDGIKDHSREQISASYRYTPDMTPGVYMGEAYDGVMRDIDFNHFCLVPEGRAGADVVVSDSAIRNLKEVFPMSKQSTVLSRKAVLMMGATVGYLTPKLALDAKPFDISPLFVGVSAKNFKDKKPAILAGIKKLATPALAKDANLEDMHKFMDRLDEMDEPKEGADADPNSGLPMSAEEMAKKAKDEEPWEKVKSVMKAKGASDEDIDAYDAMMKAGDKAKDESPEEKEKREKEERAAADKAARDAAEAEKDKDKPEMVKKEAMDAALVETRKQATADALRIANEIRAAEREVRPYVGELSIAFDSVHGVYQAALKNLNVDAVGITDMKALRGMLKAQPLPGAKRRDEPLAQDAAVTGDFAALFPGAADIALH